MTSDTTPLDDNPDSHGDKMTIRGKTPWEFACGWYGEDEIAACIQRNWKNCDEPHKKIPTNIESPEFAKWLTHEYRLAMNKGMDIIQRECRQEIERLREKNKELNRRCQQAECAIADANRTIKKLCENTEKGTPWVGGSFGRALLAYGCARYREQLAAIRAKLESIVCTDENFPGVLKLSHKITTHKETIGGIEFAVCDNEHLSPLGDALIELWQMTATK